MEHHTQIKSRQVTGSNSKGEGVVPGLESTPSGEATMHGERARNTKFDDSAPDCTKQGPMEEEHTSRTR